MNESKSQRENLIAEKVEKWLCSEEITIEWHINEIVLFNQVKKNGYKLQNISETNSQKVTFRRKEKGTKSFREYSVMSMKRR